MLHGNRLQGVEPMHAKLAGNCEPTHGNRPAGLSPCARKIQLHGNRPQGVEPMQQQYKTQQSRGNPTCGAPQQQQHVYLFRANCKWNPTLRGVKSNCKPEWPHSMQVTKSIPACWDFLNTLRMGATSRGRHHAQGALPPSFAKRIGHSLWWYYWSLRSTLLLNKT